MRSHLLAGAAGALLMFPAAAGAAGMTITGDDGNPISLTEGVPVQLRHMTPSLLPAFNGSEGQYSLGVTDPGGQPNDGHVDCQPVTSAQPTRLTYGGNGTYTVTVRTFPQEQSFACLEAATEETFSFVITAGTTVQAPAATLLTRRPWATVESAHRFGVAQNPGAFTYDLYWDVKGTDTQRSSFQAGAAPDDVAISQPGVYSFIARAAAGLHASPWSQPVKVRFMGPFDFIGAGVTRTGRGRYTLRAVVTDGRSAVGQRVTISLAKGTGRFRSIGKPRIGADAEIHLKFRERGRGRFRIRYAFAGSELVAPGTWTQKVKLGSRPSAAGVPRAG